MMEDILERLRNSSTNESSHELQCRCLDAADAIARLRADIKAAWDTIRATDKARQQEMAMRDALRAFAQDVMRVWPCGDLDGGSLQEAAEKHGLLRPETRHEPCGDGCNCAEVCDEEDFEDGVTCYRKTELLMGPMS